MPAIVGTSGWHYPSGKGTWNGVFYPVPRPRGFDELAYYAERFDTVEVNSTFYRTPEPAQAASWLRRTPAGFEFAVKLFQKFTHPDMYLARDGVSDWDLSLADVDLFRRGVDPLAEAGRLAALLVQFPPSFHHEPATHDYLDWLLRALAGYPIAVELRHRSWSDAAAETRATLSAHDAAWVLIDEPKFEQSIRQPLDAGAASLAYIRLHGRNRARWWEHERTEDRYNYLYSSADLEPFAGVARVASAAGRKVLIYTNNHFSAKSVANAAILKSQLGELLPADYYPEMVARYPALEGIVRTSRPSGLF
jgi:uncharacterized protein YecE (DUF72 family)